MNSLRSVAGLIFLAGAAVASSAPPPAAPPPAVLLAAGDIALCSNLAGADATAALLAAQPGTVAPLGDLAYPDGRSTDFRCFDHTWGRFKDRMRPSPGNHEYHSAKAKNYFAYFGDAAGELGKGYYSYELGSWHVVVLNSNCGEIGGCGAGSPQETWLRDDLKFHAARCTLAYWHYPLFSSGESPDHAIHTELRSLWRALYDAGAEIVLNGHEHNYERFAPQDPEGRADTSLGIREFVVGTGGKDFQSLSEPYANSEVRRDDTFGVLKLTLGQEGYDWEFLPIAGKTFSDRGHGPCHQAPAKTAAKPGTQSQPLRLNMP